MGGVLVDLDIEDCKRAFKEYIGYDEIDNIIDACHQKGIYGDLEEGTLPADEFRKIVLAGSDPGAKAEDVDYAMSHILVGIDPAKVQLLKDLAGKYDLYMLSNNNPIATACASRMFEQAGFSMERDFKKCYISYQMKMLKPSAEFYKAVVADIGLPADQMLFIDDSKANVQASVDAGLPAVWYEPGTDLDALIRSVI